MEARDSSSSSGRKASFTHAFPRARLSPITEVESLKVPCPSVSTRALHYAGNQGLRLVRNIEFAPSEAGMSETSNCVRLAEPKVNGLLVLESRLGVLPLPCRKCRN